MHEEKISAHVHRIGFHFPTRVVEDAYDWCMIPPGTEDYPWDVDNALIPPRHRAETNGTETQEVVRDAIRDLFPKMPAETVAQIARYSWEKVYRYDPQVPAECSCRTGCT